MIPIYKRLALIAWRNIFRNKKRSFLTMGAIAFACTALLFSMALQRGKHAELINNMVKAQSGHIQIQAKGYLDTLELTQKIDGTTEVLEQLKNYPEIQGLTTRTQSAALVSFGATTQGALVQGIDVEKETTTSNIAQIIQSGSYLDPTDSNGALIGYQLAKNIHAKIGDEIVFFGQGIDGSIAASKVIIRGICDYGISKIDSVMLIVPLNTFQQAFGMGEAVSNITILLKDDHDRPKLIQKLDSLIHSLGRNDWAVLGWPELLPGVDQLIQLDWIGGRMFYFALVVVVGFGIANTFLIAFFERIKELDMLLALGMEPKHVSWMLYAESVLLVTLGLVMGALVGTGIVFYYQQTGIYISDIGDMMRQYGFKPYLYPKLSLEVYSWAFLPTLIISMLFAIYPAWRAGKLR